MFMILFWIILGAVITFIVAICYLIVIAFTVWMAIDAGKQDRFWWLVLIIGVPVIGPGAYYFTEKKHEYAKVPVHHVHESETEEQHEQAPKKKRVRKIKEQISSEGSEQRQDIVPPQQENILSDEIVK